MLRAYKYRIYPTQAQIVLLNKTFGCIRFLWNNNVFIFNSYNKETNPNPIYKTSTELRHEFEWMREVSASSIQQKETDFIKLKKSYFSKNNKIGRPNFKKKSNSQSFRLPNQKFRLEQNEIWLEKIGNIEIQLDRIPEKDSIYKSVTISKMVDNKYFASILVDEDITPRFESTNKSVGIDLGLKDFVILSNSVKIVNPRWFRENQTKLNKAQKNLSRKKKGSRRREKCRLNVARIHTKISNQRKWFHHNLSLDLIRKYDFIGIEKLNVSEMLKNSKLSKSISDAGWSQFINFLKYKSIWNNKVVQEIDQFFPSSKLCSDCGSMNHNLKLDDRTWICKDCGVEHDRDENASINIETEALRCFEHRELPMLYGHRVNVSQPEMVAVDNEMSEKFENLEFLGLQ